MNETMVTHPPASSHVYLGLFTTPKTPVHNLTTFALYADGSMTVPALSQTTERALQKHKGFSKLGTYPTWLGALAVTSWLFAVSGLVASFFEFSSVIGVLFPVGFLGIWITAKLATP